MTNLKIQSFRLILSLLHIAYCGEWGNVTSTSLWTVNWRVLILALSKQSNHACLHWLEKKQTNQPNPHHYLNGSLLSLEIAVGLQLVLPDLQCSPCSWQYLLPKSAAESDPPKKETWRKVKFLWGQSVWPGSHGDVEGDTGQLLKIQTGSAMPCSSSGKDRYQLLQQTLNTDFSYSQPAAPAYNYFSHLGYV